MSSFFEWSALGGFLLLLAYTGRVVKNEKEVYLKNGQLLQFALFEILVPPWWGIMSDQPSKIEFVRKDTRYEWKAGLEWIQKPKDSFFSLESFLEKKLTQWEVVFDPQPLRMHSPEIIFYDQHIAENIVAAVRIEGMATQEQSNRIYLDVFLIQLKDAYEHLLLATSMSSVLNGSIEGPYFEDVLKRIRIKS